jgi:uncharacterized protein
VDAEIVVRGEAVARVLPDRATVRAVVDGDGATRDEAYAAAAEPARAVDEVIERFGEVITRTSTSSLVVQPTTRWHKGESRRTGWRASRTSSIEVEDLGQLGDLAAALAVAGAAIDGPRWQLDPTNPIHEQLRQAAAKDARGRADAYASALGLGLGAVAWVAEPGLRRTDGGEQALYARAAMGAHGGGEDVIEVTPEEIEVEVSVEVGFSFAPR